MSLKKVIILAGHHAGATILAERLKAEKDISVVHHIEVDEVSGSNRNISARFLNNSFKTERGIKIHKSKYHK